MSLEICLEINSELLYLIINVSHQNLKRKIDWAIMEKGRSSYRAVMLKEPGLLLLNGYTIDKKVKCSYNCSPNSTAKEMPNEGGEWTFP